MYTGTYHNLDVAYMFGNSIAPGSSITITYKVTTAAGVTTPLGVIQHLLCRITDKNAYIKTGW